MKRVLLLIGACLCVLQGFSNNFYFAWDGYGVATKNNFNLGKSYGAIYFHGVGYGTGLGALEFYQQFSTYYSRERMGNTGSTLQTDVQYRFFCPAAVFQLDPKRGQVQLYVDGGIGELQSNSTVTYNHWSKSAWGPDGKILNESNDVSAELKKYVTRLGFGLTQFQKIGGNFSFFVNEDMGFLTTPMVDVSDGRYNHVKTNVAQYFKPTYFSLRVGIVFIPKSKDDERPWIIYGKYRPYDVTYNW